MTRAQREHRARVARWRAEGRCVGCGDPAVGEDPYGGGPVCARHYTPLPTGPQHSFSGQRPCPACRQSFCEKWFAQNPEEQRDMFQKPVIKLPDPRRGPLPKPPIRRGKKRRGKWNPDEDASRWAELEAEGGDRSAADWTQRTYPLFASPVTNALLQAIDRLGGRWVVRQALEELSKVTGVRGRTLRSGTIRNQARAALAELVAAGFVNLTDIIPERSGFKRGERVYETTHLGTEAALASRVVPGRAAAAVVAELPDDAIEAGFARADALAAARAHARPPEYAEPYEPAEGGAEVFLPWRESGDDPFGGEKRRIRFRRREEGGHVVIEAWDESPDLGGQGIVVGELWLRFGAGDDRRFGGRAPAYASVSWVWTHPDWKERDVLTELHEYAAREARERGLALASPVDRGPDQDAFWLRQLTKHRASLETYASPGFSASRYLLSFPPPESLNPPRRRNGDEDQRRAERAYRAGGAAPLALAHKLLRAQKRVPPDVVMAITDPEARAGVYRKLLESSQVFPEHLVALAVLGDAAAREALRGHPLPDQHWQSFFDAVNLDRASVGGLYAAGLGRLGPFFCVLSVLPVVEAICAASWNREANEPLFRRKTARVFQVARAWLENGNEPGQRRKMRGRAVEVAPRHHETPGPEDEFAETEDQAVFWFFRTPHFTDPTYTDSVLRLLQRVVFYADLYPHSDDSMAAVPHAAINTTLLLSAAQTFLADHRANELLRQGQPGIAYRSPELERFADTQLRELLLGVLTPWVLSSGPGSWTPPPPAKIE